MMRFDLGKYLFSIPSQSSIKITHVHLSISETTQRHRVAEIDCYSSRWKFNIITLISHDIYLGNITLVSCMLDMDELATFNIEI